MSMSGSEVQWAVHVELSYVRVTTDNNSNAFVVRDNLIILAHFEQKDKKRKQEQYK